MLALLGHSVMIVAITGAVAGWALQPSLDQKSGPFFYSEAGYVSAAGDWKTRAGKPVNDATASGHSTAIQCRQEFGECVEATVAIVGGKPAVFLQNYRIVEWDKDSLIAEDDSAICVTTRLLISFQDRNVTAIDTPKKGVKGMPLGNGKSACDLTSHTQTYVLASQ